LEGLKVLRQEGDFPRELTIEGATGEEWRQRADPVYWFLSTATKKAVGEWISRDDLYEAFSAFCEAQGIEKASREVFFGRLRDEMPTVRDEKRRVGPTGKDGKPGAVRGFRGISLALQSEPLEDTPASPASGASPPGLEDFGDGKETPETPEAPPSTKGSPEEEPPFLRGLWRATVAEKRAGPGGYFSFGQVPDKLAADLVLHIDELVRAGWLEKHPDRNAWRFTSEASRKLGKGDCP
jgi:hypothetical protein